MISNMVSIILFRIGIKSYNLFLPYFCKFMLLSFSYNIIKIFFPIANECRLRSSTIEQKLLCCHFTIISHKSNHFSFSHFPIFPLKNAKMRKWENENVKMRKFGPISHFYIFPFSHFSMEKCEHEKMGK